MEIQTEMTKQETHYLIDLLNKDYVQLRKFKEQLLINTPPEIVAEDVKLLIDVGIILLSLFVLFQIIKIISVIASCPFTFIFN